MQLITSVFPSLNSSLMKQSVVWSFIAPYVNHLVACMQYTYSYYLCWICKKKIAQKKLRKKTAYCTFLTQCFREHSFLSLFIAIHWLNCFIIVNTSCFFSLTTATAMSLTLFNVICIRTLKCPSVNMCTEKAVWRYISTFVITQNWSKLRNAISNRFYQV